MRKCLPSTDGRCGMRGCYTRGSRSTRRATRFSSPSLARRTPLRPPPGRSRRLRRPGARADGPAHGRTGPRRRGVRGVRRAPGSADRGRGARGAGAPVAGDSGSCRRRCADLGLHRLKDLSAPEAANSSAAACCAPLLAAASRPARALLRSPRPGPSCRAQDAAPVVQGPRPRVRDVGAVADVARGMRIHRSPRRATGVRSGSARVRSPAPLPPRPRSGRRSRRLLPRGRRRSAMPWAARLPRRPGQPVAPCRTGCRHAQRRGLRCFAGPAAAHRSPGLRDGPNTRVPTRARRTGSRRTTR